MAYTSQVPISVDGIRLDTYAWNITTTGGRSSIPGVRDESEVVAGKHGIVPAYNEDFDPSEFALKMWVLGCDSNGYVAAGQDRAKFDRNLGVLLHLFSKRHAPLRVSRVMGDGSTRIADCRVVSAVAPEMDGPTTAHFAVVLQNPDVFWRDQTPITSTVSLSSGNNEITELAGTNQIRDAIIKVTGPTSTAITLKDVGSGSKITAPRQLSDGETWTFNCDTWESDINGTSARPTIYDPRAGFTLMGWFSAGDTPDTAVPRVIVNSNSTGTLSISAMRRFL